MDSFRTASARLEPISAEDRKALLGFQKRFGPDAESALLKNAEKLEAMRASYSAERREILSADQHEAIRQAVKREATEQLNGLSLRCRSLAEAKRRGVDLDRLKTAQDRLYRDFARLLDRGNRFSAGDITVRSLDVPFRLPPMVLPPDPDAGTLYIPPFGEPWERTVISHATGDGRVTENRSYLDAAWGCIGSHLVGHNHDASDHDEIMIYRQNGFMVPFTMPATGPLQVSADLICLFCQHHISTSDEWGWSDFHGFTRSTLVLSVYWDYDDTETTCADQTFVPGLDSRGDGESYPGTVVQVDPGEQRSVDFYTDFAFPAGKTVWVYVGIADFVWAMLNDVAIDISLHSAWQLSSLRVSPL